MSIDDDPQTVKARLSEVAADVRDVYQDAVCCINDLQEENRELQAERDELVVQLAETLELQADHVGGSIPVKNLYIGNFKAPRAITADELEEGQTVVCWTMRPDDGQFISAAGTVKRFEHIHGKRSTVWLQTEEGEVGWDFDEDDGYTIILLADAPDEQQEPERGSLRTWGTESGTLINTDPFNSAEPERLTVADLENAPVGSTVANAAGLAVRKDAWGDWVILGQSNARYTHEQMMQWPNATLTLPTPAPVTAETIRESEPGDTFEDRDGVVLEWDGIWLSYHDDSGGLGAVISAGQAEITYGPLTRSTAAPRGDYGKTELPTEPRVTIDPAAYETMFSDQEFLQRLHNEITRNRLQGDPAAAHERTDDD